MKMDSTTCGACDVTIPAFTAELLDEAGITGLAATPAANHLFIVDLNTTKLDSVAKELFHSTVAMLLYMSKRTRPYMLLPISFLTTRVQEPNVDDQPKVNRACKYLYSTRELGICLEIDNLENDNPQSTLFIKTYIDASMRCTSRLS